MRASFVPFEKEHRKKKSFRVWKTMKAVVFGSSGAVGSRLLRQLCTDAPEHWSLVHAIVRRPLISSIAELSDNVSAGTLKESIVEDFGSVDALSSAVSQVSPDVVFCCLGSTIKKAGSKTEFYKQDHDAIVNVARASRNCPSVRLFSLVSSAGANASSFFFYMKVKGEVERDVSEMGFERTVIWRPGMLTHANRSESRPAEKIFEKLVLPWTSWMMRGKNEPNPVENVAAAMRLDAANFLSHPPTSSSPNPIVDIRIASEINAAAKPLSSS